MIAADLVHAESYRFILGGVLAFDHQHRDAVDEKDHILPCAVVPIVKGPLLSNLINVALMIIVIDQDQVEFAVLVVIKKLTMVAQVFDKITVAIDVCGNCRSG